MPHPLSDQPLHDTVIVGGGPAGLSAALVLARCRRNIFICDSGRYRNERSQALHCYMGHDGIAPEALLDHARRQLASYDGATLARAHVDSAVREADGFSVQLASGRRLRARTLLVATGVVDEVPRIEGIETLWGRSVHVCPYCDGWEHRDAPVAVYGRGEKGAGLALLLRQWTDDLVLCTDGPSGLSPSQLERLERGGIGFCETPMAKLEGTDGCLQNIHFRDGSTLARRAMFFNTDQHPRSPLLEKLGCEFADNGGVSCGENGDTSLSGVYVAGDVSRDVQLAIIAAAEGARAALAINKMLLREDGFL